MRTSEQGIDLIKYFEGLRLHAYQDEAGVWTIGYGHTGSVEPAMVISEDQAESLLRADLVQYENNVERLIKHHPEQHQFDAMVSLCYNIGRRGFERSSVLFFFNKKDIDMAADSFRLWNKIRVEGELIPSKILTRRREIERDLFKTGVYYEP